MDNQSMELTIQFTGFKQVRLILTAGEKQLDAVDFAFDSNLDTMLIDSIDKLLKKNRISKSSLNLVKVTGEVDENSSAYKVAITCAEALKSL